MPYGLAGQAGYLVDVANTYIRSRTTDNAGTSGVPAGSSFWPFVTWRSRPRGSALGLLWDFRPRQRA